MAYALHEQASQETLVSLLQLDPAPIESPYAEDEKDLQFSPEDDAEHTKPTTAGSPTPLGLSRSNSHASHNSIYYLTRIQKYSSYLIPVFTTIHLANTSLIPLITRSVPASETYLLQARELYQTTLTEPLLVTLPIAAHIASGLALRLIRRSQNLARYGGSTPGMAWWGVQGAVVAVAALWAAGGLGVVARGGPTHGWVGKVYDSIYDVLPW
ncbi:putative transporter C11D3.05 [Verticillium dahliae VDG2]|nr:putative transporter C11D3.05 [Verticillium dahliae VDG2]